MPRPPQIPVRKQQANKANTLGHLQLEVAELIQRGVALHQQGHLAQADVIYQQVLAKQANHFDALHLSGVIALQNKNPALAVKLICRAIEINANDAAAYCNLGVALKELGRLKEALVSYERAIEIKPDYAEAYNNRGHTLQALERQEEALASYDNAIAIKRDYVKAYSNRGNALKEIKHLEEALASYEKAIAINPDFSEAHWNKSVALLLAGEIEQGFKLYEWRWKNEALASPKRNFPQPLWLGVENIAGKTILLHAEQGLGDTIQFCRYAKMVKSLGARVVLEVPPALSGLLNGLQGVDTLVQTGQVLPDFDYHCPLMSLSLPLCRWQ